MKLASSYQTTYLKIVPLDAIEQKLLEYVIRDYPYESKHQPFRIHDKNHTHIILTDSDSRAIKEIPYFSNVIKVKEKDWFVTDARRYTAFDKNTRKTTLKNNYPLVKLVMDVLYEENSSKFTELRFAGLVFASWLADNIVKRFMLDLGDSHRLKHLGILYFESMFVDRLMKDDLEKIIIKYRSITTLDEELLRDTFSMIDEEPIQNFQGYCDLAYKVTENIRVKGLQFAGLASILSNQWYGFDAKEDILASLEYPPIWYAIVYKALTDRSFNKSYIGKAVLELNKRNRGTEYTQAMEAILREMIEDLDRPSY